MANKEIIDFQRVDHTSGAITYEASLSSDGLIIIDSNNAKCVAERLDKALKEQALLDELFEMIVLAPEMFREIESGECGEGIAAKILMSRDWTYEQANKHIWGDEYEEDEI